jgi:hypothetical protein
MVADQAESKTASWQVEKSVAVQIAIASSTSMTDDCFVGPARESLSRLSSQFRRKEATSLSP